MIVKLIQNGRDNNNENATYVFSNVKNYTVIENFKEESTQLILDGQVGTFTSDFYDSAFIMNDEGKTIDTICFKRIKASVIQNKVAKSKK